MRLRFLPAWAALAVALFSLSAHAQTTRICPVIQATPTTVPAYATLMGTERSDQVAIQGGCGDFSTLKGRLWAGATAPVATSCGTSPAVLGSDSHGQVTLGTGTPAGCVLTFTKAFVSAPMCVVTWQSGPLAAMSWTTSTAALTLTQTATSSTVVDWFCVAQNGG